MYVMFYEIHQLNESAGDSALCGLALIYVSFTFVLLTDMFDTSPFASVHFVADFVRCVPHFFAMVFLRYAHVDGVPEHVCRASIMLQIDHEVSRRSNLHGGN